MSEPRFLTVTREQAVAGSWFEAARAAWTRGEIGLVRIEPAASEDAELRQAIATMLDSNGSYEPGDRAVIHARHAAIEMGCETAHQLRERGIEATIVLGLSSLGPEVQSLIDLACRAAERAGKGPAAPSSSESPEASTRDFSRLDPAILEGIASGYRALIAPLETAGRGHWIVPVGTAPDPDPTHVPALDFYTQVAGRALAPIGVLRNDGRIRSHDIWLCPSPLDVERLNEGLPVDQHWTLDEWRSLAFRSMAVSGEELRRLALEIEGVHLTIEASRHGGLLSYAREDGTEFTYRVKDRPVILDCGSVGVHSLGGTTEYRSAITNQPTTEVFVAPIEDSLTGVIVYPIPERTVHGTIQPPYRIEVRDGRVIGVEAPDDESRKILRHYTGVEPYDGRSLSGAAHEAFLMRQVIAEKAIAGFNPAMLPAIRSGRLRPVTGLVLTDEKLGDHQAFGANDQFMGATPSAYRDEHVEHTDFVGTIDRVMHLR